MRFGIKAKLILLSSILTLTASSFFGWFSIQHEKNTLRDELNERMNSLTNNLATNSEYGLLTFNEEELNRLAQNTLRQKDICFVRIEDKEGKVLSEVGEKKANEPMQEYSASIVSEQLAYKTEEMMLDFKDKTKEKQIGKVTITISLSSFYRKLKELELVVFAVIMIIFVFVTTFITLLVNRYISSPIKRLIFATESVAKGNLDYEVNIKSKDEIGVLSGFFNKMTKDLRKSKGEIEEYNKTLEKKVEERTRELKDSQERLLQSDKMAAVGQLAGGVSHEINNPLGVILGFAQVIAKNVKEGDNLYMPLKSIEREALRCKILVSDLLTFSRTGKSTMELIDLNTAIGHALALVETRTKTQNIEIIRNFQEDLPKITANGNQIQQIIINLCNNSIDAMPQSAPKNRRITIETKKLEKEIEIAVSDTGTGISEETRKHLF